MAVHTFAPCDTFAAFQGRPVSGAPPETHTASLGKAVIVNFKRISRVEVNCRIEDMNTTAEHDPRRRSARFASGASGSDRTCHRGKRVVNRAVACVAAIRSHKERDDRIRLERGRRRPRRRNVEDFRRWWRLGSAIRSQAKGIPYVAIRSACWKEAERSFVSKCICHAILGALRGARRVAGRSPHLLVQFT